MPTHKITLTRAQVSNLFRHAAELMEVKHEDDDPYFSNFYKYDFSCHALDKAMREANVSWPDECLINAEYARLFKPASVSVDEPWFGRGESRKNDLNRQRRVHALLLAAEAHKLGRR